MKSKCMFCGKREGKVFFSVTAIDPVPNGIEFSNISYACYECLADIFKTWVNIIYKKRGCSKKKNTILPSIPWARRIRMGKISKNELLDIMEWIKSIKHPSDFKENK